MAQCAAHAPTAAACRAGIAPRDLRRSALAPARQAGKPGVRQQAGAVTASAAGAAAEVPSGPADLSRRQLLSATAASLAAVAAGSNAAGRWAAPPAAEAAPLAPLGGIERVGGEKLTGLTPQQVADILARNLREGQYFVTGDLTPEVFADNCRFKDPTNDVVGLSRYVKALGLLFDASYSAVQLKDIRVTGPATIEADWVLGGYLRFPWHPRVEPFQGHTVYHLNSEGLIALQDQTWSITGATALAESFTPTPGFKTDIKQQLSATA